MSGPRPSCEAPDPGEIPAYFARYDNLKFQRDGQGVLEVTMHTHGGELLWNEQTHEEFADAFHDISRDRANRVAILTGSGENWLARLDPAAAPRFSDPLVWNRIFMDGAKMLENMLDIHAPIICALNGPARVHSELALLCDILLASDRTVFQDRHLEWGLVPGDGVQIVWPHVLGPTRGRYFLLTGEKIDARRALDLGVVNEVLPDRELMPRARALAAMLAARSPMALRYSRVAFAAPLKRMVQESIGYGLALEGLSAARGG